MMETSIVELSKIRRVESDKIYSRKRKAKRKVVLMKKHETSTNLEEEEGRKNLRRRFIISMVPHENHAIVFHHVVCLCIGCTGHSGSFRQVWDVGASSTAVELPAMEGASQTV
jgi:hypothetical protein